MSRADCVRRQGGGGVHPHRQPVVSGDHGQEGPAVPLIKGRVVRHQIQCIDAHVLHIRADKPQHLSPNAAAAVRLFHVYGADVGRQVRPVVKVVFNHADAGCDPFSVHHHIPLRHRRSPPQAGFHAFPVFFFGNAPFFTEPGRGLLRQFAVFPDLPYLV